MTLTAEIQEKAQRYLALRDTISGLEDEKEKLRKELQQLLSARGGELQLSENHVRLVLQKSRRITYDLLGFRDQFGMDAVLEVSKVDRKLAETYAKNLPASEQALEKLDALATVKVVTSLVVKDL